MSNRDHKLFQQFPLSQGQMTSVGKVATPYHVYDGFGILIGGTADLGCIKPLLQHEMVHPLTTKSGRALMAVWAVDFTDASLGPHMELQYSILVSHQPQPPINDHPLALLKSLFTNPEARMLCYRLWNNSETAVAYNRELLGLNAKMSKGAIKRENGKISFHFMDRHGRLLCVGELPEATRTPSEVSWSMFRLFGLRHTIRAITSPYLEAKVVNTTDAGIVYNADARSYLASDTPIVRFFDPAVDQLQFGPDWTSQVDFTPDFVEQFDPFRFVYLQPE